VYNKSHEFGHTQLRQRQNARVGRSSFQGNELTLLRQERTVFRVRIWCFAVFAVVAPSLTAQSPRAAAIAALKAVRSAGEAGGTISDVRKYMIDARVKIDALPESAANAPLRSITRLFTDALTFGDCGGSSNISEFDLNRAKKQYAADDSITKSLLAVRVSEPLLSTEFWRSNAVDCQIVMLRLLDKAYKELDTLDKPKKKP
jgi:hypothetical protein